MEKKAAWNQKLVIVILCLATLIVMAFIVKFLLVDKYSDSVLPSLECKASLTLVHQDAAQSLYFGQGLDSFRPRFIDMIETKCPYQEIKVRSDEEIRKVADIADDCWRKFGSGDNILPTNAYGQTLCVICGEVVFEDTIESFDEKFVEMIKEEEYSNLKNKESEISNMNGATLYGDSDKDFIPKKIEEDSRVNMIYFISKAGVCEGQGVDECISRSADYFYGEFASLFAFTSFINSLGTTSEDVIGGVVLGEIPNFDEGSFSEQRVDGFNLLGDQQGQQLRCSLLIAPEKK